jgi:hypothetical protein
MCQRNIPPPSSGLKTQPGGGGKREGEGSENLVCMFCLFSLVLAWLLFEPK